MSSQTCAVRMQGQRIPITTAKDSGIISVPETTQFRVGMVIYNDLLVNY